MRLVLTILAVGACDGWPQDTLPVPPDREWYDDTWDDALPLLNAPSVAASFRRGSELFVKVTNGGDTVLTYYGASRHHAQWFQETQQHGIWRKGLWDWCGTGKSDFELLPGESVDLVVRFADRGLRERVLTRFTEKGTDRAALVVLATEPR